MTERYTRLKTLTQEIKQRMDAKDFAAVIALLQAEQQNAQNTRPTPEELLEMNPWAKGTEAQPSAYQLFVIGCRDGRRTKKSP